jgi:hypothetical protein
MEVDMTSPVRRDPSGALRLAVSTFAGGAVVAAAMGIAILVLGSAVAIAVRVIVEIVSWIAGLAGLT